MAHRIRVALAARAAAAVLLATAIIIAWTQSQGAAQAESARGTTADGAVVRVVDGETIEDLRTDAIYRLDNIDTGRADQRAGCASERRIGDRAAAAASALVARARQLQVLPTGKVDRAGRPTAFVLADGRDLGEALIARGFARPIRDDGQPWCDADGALIL